MKRSKKNACELAWHYTIGSVFPKILRDGMLEPNGPPMLEDEKPVIWFSINQVWEPSATPLCLIDEDHVAKVNLKHVREEEGALFRFGVPKETLIPWRQMKTVAKIDTHHASLLPKLARKTGANLAQWYGSLKPVSIHDCRIEYESGPGNWNLLSSVLRT